MGHLSQGASGRKGQRDCESRVSSNTDPWHCDHGTLELSSRANLRRTRPDGAVTIVFVMEGRGTHTVSSPAPEELVGREGRAVATGCAHGNNTNGSHLVTHVYMGVHSQTCTRMCTYMHSNLCVHTKGGCASLVMTPICSHV